MAGGNAFPAGTSHTVSGLEEGTAYQARVRARYHNSVGKVEKSGPWSAAQEATVYATPAPTPAPTAQPHGPAHAGTHGAAHAGAHGAAHGPAHAGTHAGTHGATHGPAHAGTHAGTHGATHGPAHAGTHGAAHGPATPAPTANSVSESGGEDLLASHDTAGRIVTGEEGVSGSLPACDSDWYAMTLTEGLAYSFTLQGENRAARLNVYDGDGERVTDIDGRDSTAVTQVPGGEDAEWFLAVERTDAETCASQQSTGRLENGQDTWRSRIQQEYGERAVRADRGDNYQVSLRQLTDMHTADTTTSGTVTVGGSIRGNIDSIGDVDWFAVTLTAGNSYLIDIEGLRAEPFGDLTLIVPRLVGVYDDAGVYLEGTSRTLGGTGNGQNTRHVVTATETGKHFIAVASADLDLYVDLIDRPRVQPIGTYKLSVADLTDYADVTMAAPTLSSTSPGELTISWTAPSLPTRYYTIQWAKNADDFRAYTDPLGSPYGEDGVHFVNEFGIVRSSASPITITNLDRAVVYKARVTPHLWTQDQAHVAGAGTLRSGTPSPAATITINGAAFTEVAPATLVSNFGQAVRAHNPVASVAGSHPRQREEAQASPFTTGSNSAGYNLDWVSLVINPPGGQAEADATVSVSIWTSADDGMPGTKVYDLSYSQLAPNVFGGGPPHKIATRFQAPADATLDADTDYHIVVESPESDVYNVSAVADPDEDAGSAAGWSIGDDTVYRRDGTWRSGSIDRPFRMAIAGSEIPTN